MGIRSLNQCHGLVAQGNKIIKSSPQLNKAQSLYFAHNKVKFAIKPPEQGLQQCLLQEV